MIPGTYMNRFMAKDGKEVILRAPRWDDLDDMLDFINSLVDEDAMIAANQRQTRDQEIEYMTRVIANVEKDKQVRVVAEVDGTMVGSCEVTPRFGRMSHIGGLGISVKQGYRSIGIGHELMKEAEKQALRLGMESIYLEVFRINEHAIHVYSRMGYKETGCIPKCVKYQGGYVDSIIMVKHLRA